MPWHLVLFLIIHNYASAIPISIHPNINNTVASYAARFHVHINPVSFFDGDLILQQLVLCVSYEENVSCNRVNKVIVSYDIGLTHTTDVTTIMIYLCTITNPTDTEAYDCDLPSSINSTKLVLRSPVLSALGSLVLPNEHARWNRPVGLLVGGNAVQMKIALAISTDIRMYLLPEMLRFCESYVSAFSVECCALPGRDRSCDPPVADFALLYVSKADRVSAASHLRSRLLELLSLVNGRLLIMSADLVSAEEVIVTLPSALRKLAHFHTARPEDYGLELHCQVILVVDLAELWFTRSLQLLSTPDTSRLGWPVLVPISDIAPSAVQFSHIYGINTASLNNVCLFNRTSLLLFKRFDNASDRYDDVLSDADVQVLQASSSGFHPVHIDSEAVSGWRFVELTNSREDCENNRDGDCPEVLWLRGTHILATPAYPKSTIHLAQTLLAVVHASFHPQVYPWICNASASSSMLLLPTLSRYENQWALSFISQVRAFLRHQLTRGTLASFCPATDATVAGLSLVALQEDIKSAVQRDGPVHEQSFRYSYDTYNCREGRCRGSAKNVEDESTGGRDRLLCFESVALLGSTELTSPFLSSVAEGTAFREFAHDYMRVGEFITPGRTAYSRGKCVKEECAATVEDLGPNDALRVTVVSRSENRWIRNIGDLLACIEAIGVADVSWLYSASGGGGGTGGRYFEVMSVREQMHLMRYTDVLVLTHGAGIMNMIYMQPHSAVLEVLTSPWYEPAYQCTALAVGLAYFALPQPDISRSSNCGFLRECLALPVARRSQLSCFGIRQCNVIVDLISFEIVLWQAVQSVRILKRAVHRRRIDGSRNVDYWKPLKRALSPLV